MRSALRRLGSFSAVGTVAFVVDVLFFNILCATVLDGHPAAAKVISVIVATTVSWLGSRHFTFRDGRSRSLRTEAALFALTNVIGLLIAVGCLLFSRHVLGIQSRLGDNIATNGVGLALGNTFRYFSYTYLVYPAFRVRTAPQAGLPPELPPALAEVSG